MNITTLKEFITRTTGSFLHSALQLGDMDRVKVDPPEYGYPQLCTVSFKHFEDVVVAVDVYLDGTYKIASSSCVSTASLHFYSAAYNRASEFVRRFSLLPRRA